MTWAVSAWLRPPASGRWKRARPGRQAFDGGHQLAQALGRGGRVVGGGLIGDIDPAELGSRDLAPGRVAGGGALLAAGAVDHQVQRHAVEHGLGVLDPRRVAPRDEFQIELLGEVLGRGQRGPRRGNRTRLARRSR